MRTFLFALASAWSLLACAEHGVDRLTGLDFRYREAVAVEKEERARADSEWETQLLRACVSKKEAERAELLHRIETVCERETYAKLWIEAKRKGDKERTINLEKALKKITFAEWFANESRQQNNIDEAKRKSGDWYDEMRKKLEADFENDVWPKLLEKIDSKSE